MQSKPLLLCLALVLIASAVLISGCKKIIVGADEAGIIQKKNGSLTVFNPGETHYIFPLFQQFYLISTKPTVLSFINEEGVHIAASNHAGIIESQLSYLIQDLPKAVRYFGADEIHKQIRNALKTELATIIKKQIPDVTLLDDPGKRIPLTAQIHLDLNSSIADKGIEITGFQLRIK